MGYNFASSFGFQFRLEIYKLFFSFFLLEVSQRTTALNFEHIRFLACILLYRCQFFLHSFRPWAAIQLSPQI
jgi:hypothetical protein